MGGMITQIAEHLRYGLNLSSDTPVAGKSKIDMGSLIHQGMIPITNNSYSPMSRVRFVLELPTPNRVSIVDLSNWLYASAVPEEQDYHKVDDFVAGDTMEEDATFQQQFIPPSQDPTQQGTRSFTMDQDQWIWMQAEFGDLRAKQTRQGVENIQQGAMLEEVYYLLFTILVVSIPYFLFKCFK